MSTIVHEAIEKWMQKYTNGGNLHKLVWRRIAAGN
jgi:hypothetical protein